MQVIEHNAQEFEDSEREIEVLPHEEDARQASEITGTP